jgi:seryl-tRNA synthetase
MNDWADLSRITQVSGSAPIASRGGWRCSSRQADVLGAAAARRRRLHADDRAGARPPRRPSSRPGPFPRPRGRSLQLPNDDLWLAGTGEIALTSLHSGEILEADEAADPLRRLLALLPPRGGQRRARRARAAARPPVLQGRAICDLRGRRGESARWHARLLANAESCCRTLEIPYQVIETSTGDMGLGKYRMNDIESWVPSLGKYRETHSCSTCTTGRRGARTSAGATGAARCASPHAQQHGAGEPAHPRAAAGEPPEADGRVRLPGGAAAADGRRVSLDADPTTRAARLLRLREGRSLAPAPARVRQLGAARAGGRAAADGHPRLPRHRPHHAGLQRALAEAGYRVTGWGMGLNRGVTRRHARPARRAVERFGGASP